MFEKPLKLLSIYKRLVAITLTMGISAIPTVASNAKEITPSISECPDGVPSGVKCFRGIDSVGSHYLIAMPTQWSGILVVHAHGGPALGTPQMSRADEDIKRWAITLTEGHAWAGSVFRQGGFAVTTAAQDTERVRRIFTDHVAKPRLTLLHGQSWGAMVATRAAELFPESWEGILLTSGVVAGPTTYDFRLDLRAIYQYLCNNHPRQSEAQYSLSIGLPNENKMNTADLLARADECLGVRLPASLRTPQQTQKLKIIVDVLRIPENSVVGHLMWGTFSLQDVTQKNGGLSPLGNYGVQYKGSSNDAELNAGVPRFKADPQAVARFAADVDHNGRFVVPVISAHGINDSTVFVEGQDTLRQRMIAAGNGDRLVQAFVNSSEHSYWGDAMYPPLFEALLKWVEGSVKPTPDSIAALCKTMRSAAPQDCLFNPNYSPEPLSSRIAPR